MTDPSASRYLGGAVNFGSRQALELSPLGNTWGARDNLDEPVMIAVVQTSNKRSVEQLKKIGFRVRRGLEEFGGQQLLMEYPLQAEPGECRTSVTAPEVPTL